MPGQIIHPNFPTSSPATRPSHLDHCGCLPASSSAPSSVFSASNPESSVEDTLTLLQPAKRFPQAHLTCPVPCSPHPLVTHSPLHSPWSSCTGLLTVVHMHQTHSCPRTFAWLFSLPRAPFLQNVVSSRCQVKCRFSKSIFKNPQVALPLPQPHTAASFPCSSCHLKSRTLFLSLAFPSVRVLCECRAVAASSTSCEHFLALSNGSRNMSLID